ncbi:MAG: hypothetical protein M3N34_03350 [Pseudomonadota bacterium]|nr:hypothetical protein [Pseudomonadota bacterium]
MTPTETILIILALVLVAVGAALFMRKRRTGQLKSQFGAEYDRVVHQSGSETKAEAMLAARQKRVSSYTIKPLSTEMRDHFIETWRAVQAQFVDDPKYAVTRADDLLGEVMLARGYPVHDFAQRSEDLSVDHPNVVQHYRTGHEIAVNHSQGQASTEDLRNAMIHFRALFDDLVNEPVASTSPQVVASNQ